MRIKSAIAASGVLALLAAFVAFPAAAQQKGPVAPVCANCHEAQWKAIDLTQHGAKNDAGGSMRASVLRTCSATVSCSRE